MSKEKGKREEQKKTWFQYHRLVEGRASVCVGVCVGVGELGGGEKGKAEGDVVSAQPSPLCCWMAALLCGRPAGYVCVCLCICGGGSENDSKKEMWSQHLRLLHIFYQGLCVSMYMYDCVYVCMCVWRGPEDERKRQI